MFDGAGSLGEAIRGGQRSAVLVFGGQDPDWADQLRRVLATYPRVRPWAVEVLRALEDRLSAAPGAVPGLAGAGLDPTDWLERPEQAFDRSVRASATHCMIGSSLGQLLSVRALAESEVLEEPTGIVGAVGHSAGLLSSWAVARHGTRVPVDAAAEVLFAFALLTETSARHPGSLSTAELDGLLTGRSDRAVMLSVAGPTESRLEHLLATHAGSSVRICLQNSWDRFVLCGTRTDVAAVAETLEDEPGVATERVPSSSPYHHPMLAEIVDTAADGLRAHGVRFEGELRFPVVDPRDGSSHSSGDLGRRMVESLYAEPVRWADTLAGTVGAGGVVLDVGPSSLAAAMARRALRGSGATVVALGTDQGLRQFTGSEEIEPLADWSVHAPVVSAAERTGGAEHRIETRHTRRTNRSAFVLAGMNPTTVDVGIVAAAANAGHVAELAGGGQVSATIFSERMVELGEALGAGHEVCFNALFLDPYLWDLHVGRDRMVQRARAAGAPICGVTVSAGIPETDEAVALLEELDGLGIWLNAFKPGTVEQVHRVLDIADRVEADLWLHMEGGRAGGHHSWVELEDLLFATYADIRRRDNVVLCVGGGVGSPERAAELLSGGWSLRHCAMCMPVDAVLLGTVAMATAESTASQSVKAALVAAPGTDELVRSGEWGGGVTSARSVLGADIHCLRSHAARVAELLEEVAGDAQAVAERHDEIAEALAGTAKPWFGDLRRMTYAGMLERFAELCARGRHGRYEDGRWLDRTLRSRFLDLLRRTEARCGDLDEGELTSIFRGPHDLDEPEKAIAMLRERYPLVERVEMEPTDVAHFVEVCDGPGKPVPFVAVIDSEVRRRYLVDSLWQSHSDLWTAEEVLAIPGPVSVAGITVLDEPVAELMARFDARAAEHMVPATSDAAVGGTSGEGGGDDLPAAVEVLLSLATLRQGDRWTASPFLGLGDLADWDVRPLDTGVEAVLVEGAERVRLRGPDGTEGRVEVELSWPALTELDADGELRFEVVVGRDHGVPWAMLDPASLGTAQQRVLDFVVSAAEPVADSALAGDPAAPAPLVDPVAVPDATIRLLWPGLFGALRDDGAGDGLLQLVHAHHRVRTASDGPHEATVHAAIVGHDNVPAGRRIHTSSVVGDKVVEDTFLLRGWSGGDADDPPPEPPVDPAGAWLGTERHHLAAATRVSPRNPEQFALVSGDLNPIHRSNLLARFTGLPGRIVHGMWTSATAQSFLVSDVLEGDVHRLRDWEIDFMDMVLPGEPVRLTATRVGLRDGHRRVEVMVEGPRGVVARALADIAPVRTAYVFPGQGIQARGMGMEGYDRSPAARDVWDRADRFCRDRLGFSILDVVRRNPEQIHVRDEVHRHPEGVLNLTQFTQVAMATLAAAQVEELRERGAFDPDAVLAGHSVGEYNALGAVAGVLPLEAVLGIVWARGTAMHHLVEREEDGSSRFRLGVVRPHLAGLDAEAATALVDEVGEQTGELCQVVNHNLRGRQYAVAGTVRALQVLQDRLGSGEEPTRPPFLLIPGIDVPFHSRALSGGVEEFRSHLEEVLPPEIDHLALVGRYVPNLHPVPFVLERAYVEAVAEACEGRACQEILRRWSELSQAPRRLARELLVELLAWQFASPVRWIESTDVLLAPATEGGLGVERVVEVGLGATPTLANLTGAAVAAARRPDVAVEHVELHEASVFDTEADAAPEDPATSGEDGPDDLELEQDWDGDAPGPGSPSAAVAGAPTSVAGATAAATATAPVAPGPAAAVARDVQDRPVTTAEAVAALLAHEVQLTPEQLGDDSVERLVDGASSRRNQVMMDMGREFGIGAVDGAHEVDRDDLAERLSELARSYRFPGPVLGSAISAGVASTLGPLGAGPTTVEDHIGATWQLGQGWVDRCRLELFLGTRDGASRRGGPLRTLPAASDPIELIDAALAAAAARSGVVLEQPATASSGSMVDSGQLEELLTRVDEAFSASARAAAEVLSPDDRRAAAGGADPVEAERAARLAVLDQEHGAERAEAVAPVFDPRTVRWFSSGVPWARADLDHLFHALVRGDLGEPERTRLVRRLRRFWGTDERFDASVRWYGSSPLLSHRPELAEVFSQIGLGPDPEDGDLDARLRGRVVLVSGGSPGSIAESVVARLLEGGATVVLLTSSTDPARRRAARELERRHGGPGAQLYLVRANLASFTDVDRLCQWLDTPPGESSSEGAPAGPGLPDVVLPFAAPRVMGDVPDSGPRTELELRVLLLGVERLVGGLSERIGAAPGERCLTAVLPLSPNHGTFGGDGAYGVAKAGLEVLISRRRSEHRRWGRHCRVVAAEIGWVRGTGLMASNDSLVPLVEQRLGVRTWSSEEMGEAVAALCVPGTGETDVMRVDLTGGLADLDDPGALADLMRAELPGPIGDLVEDDGGSDDEELLAALPTPRSAKETLGWPDWPREPELRAEDMIVICGVGEIGPWGTSETRAEVEQQGELSAQGVIELALLCGLVEWRASGVGAFVDVDSGEVVPEHELAERYRSEVEARCGIRADDQAWFVGDASVFTDRSLRIGVASEAEARVVAAGSEGAVVEPEEGRWTVVLPAGSLLRLPRRVDLPRRVTAPLPDGLQPTALGIPVELSSSVDPLAAWNLAFSAEAFRDAGTDPDELLGAVHPARVADTQGCGMGGMVSLERLFMDPVRGVAHANDMLQEALPNVPAAHAMQGLLGGYGSAVHPVGACATAAVSLEVATDLVRLGKADVVLAGGFDALSNVGIIGFADMSATADDDVLAARGFEPREMSRPGDRSRAGFVESEGGGSFVVCRGSVAVALGLPVRAVVAMASTHSDGLQRSIPAPGLGALSVGMGGMESPLALALRAHGLCADDVGVVSKHDTSTRANDPNEAGIHERLQELLGRSPGNPLRVVSQKSLTGHAKGGAAAWQVAGLCDVFDTGIVPGNPNLDSVDPDVAAGPWLVVDDRPLRMHEPPRAALLTSLGFGHVSAVVLLVHPAAFGEALPEHERSTWSERAARRRSDAARLRRWQLFGGPPAFRRRDVRFVGDTASARAEAEREVLADPAARLDPGGRFPGVPGGVG